MNVMFKLSVLRFAAFFIPCLSIGLIGSSTQNHPAIGASLSPVFSNISDDKPSQIEIVSGDPTDRGRIVRRRGGAGHGDCAALARQSQDLITSIVPRFAGEGLTVDSHPMFWIYLPYSLSDDQSVNFVLKDEAGAVVYNPNLLATSIDRGVVSLRLPDGEKALIENQEYTWTFTLTCGDMRFWNEGVVKRVAQSNELENALKAASTPEAKAAAYRDAGLWLDAITVLGNGRRRELNNEAVQTAWTDLLTAIGLSDIASKPIADCCTASK
jgi:Domain of Unknown Function (DUF928)